MTESPYVVVPRHLVRSLTDLAQAQAQEIGRLQVLVAADAPEGRSPGPGYSSAKVFLFGLAVGVIGSAVGLSVFLP